MLATTAMLADKLGVEPETIHKWWNRYKDDAVNPMPPPKFPGVYDVDVMVAWCEKRGLPKKQGGSE